MTEFDKELELINKLSFSDNLDTTLRMIIAFARDGEATPKDVYVHAIKQAVDKYVIGEDQDMSLFKANDLTSNLFYASQNDLRDDQRKSLWGDQ